MFCKEQVAQLRDALPEIENRDGVLKIIGSGRPHQAVEFQKELSIDSEIFSDPHMKAYRAAGLRRNVRSNVNLGTLADGARALKKGFRQSKVKGDPWQQGGVFVIKPDGSLIFEYVSQRAGDHPPLDQILDALDRART